MKRGGAAFVFAAVFATAADTSSIDRARQFYDRTEYESSLKLLVPSANADAAALLLTGQDYYMLGEYKKATDAFDHALALGMPTEELYLWMGRAYGRRAETSGPFTAPGLATKARKYFETAVRLNIMDKEATGDLLDYYMGAPGFLGGGIDRARALTQRVLAADPAEGQHMLAVIAEHDKQYSVEEQHLRRAIQLAPHQAMRLMELARFFAKHGRLRESDEEFEQASRMAPNDHRILFYRAETYIEGKRNLGDARSLLETYLRAQLRPEDPPREKARELLKKAQIGE